MSDPRKLQIKAFKEVTNSLTQEDVKKLQNAINIPSGIRQNIGTNPAKFLNYLKSWNQFKPETFHFALKSIGKQSILPKVKKIEWLSMSYTKPKTSKEPKSLESLVELLTTEISIEEWISLASISSKVTVKVDDNPNEMLKVFINNEIITRNMKDLSESLELVERVDLAREVIQYESIFKNMSREEFRTKIHQELEGNKSEDNTNWEECLRKFMKIHNKDVNVVLDETKVPIESVYTPLTVIKMKPAEERDKEESGINEIEFLRTMHSKVEHETVEVVDFESIITTCNSSDSNLFVLIGSAGSGKSFMCKHFAYLYGINSLKNFCYTLAINCRNDRWHKLEETRHEKKKEIDSEFILNWLTICMSMGTKWSEWLSQHLLKSDGAGLFLILDGVDEFTNSVPFKSTLLYGLLKRRFLVSSTILVTSRPSAWSEIIFQYGKKFKITGNFQMIGFTPKNRVLYFSLRMETLDKLTAVHEMFYRHEEIEQLALVPVNASLFSSLFNTSESIQTQTLSHIYSQLVVYIIRRQLSRIGQKQQSQVRQMSQFHPGIQECIQAIAREANQGVFERELTSDKPIPLKIGGQSLPSERLGLMQAHVKLDSLGHRVKVWSFQHLSIQEYMAAVSICNNSWPNQCLIVRYLSSSVKYLSMYRLVIRFVCGILTENAGRMTSILCRHTLPQPMSLTEVPMIYQLNYYTTFLVISGWEEFTKSFLLLCTVISEMNCDSIPEHFKYFANQFPQPLYLSFQSNFSLNEFHCLSQLMPYIHEFHVIHVNSSFVSIKQFHSLLINLHLSPLDYLVLTFIQKDFESILPYTSLLSSEVLHANTRISINFQSCDFSDCPYPQWFFHTDNKFIGSLNLHESPMNPPMLRNLTNQFASLQNLYYSPKSDYSNWPIIHQLITNHKLKGLYIWDYPGYLPLTADILSGHSSLEELFWYTRPHCYSVLEYLHRLSSITYLNLASVYPPPNTSYVESISQLISNNATSLREISLDSLDRIGFTSWNSILDLVSICPILISLQLVYCDFPLNDTSCWWYRALKVMKSLVNLSLFNTPLQDSGMLVLCHSLNYHPAIRRIRIQECSLSSDSCLPLKYLILTPPHFKMLDLSRKELSNPDPDQLDLLVKAAEECSIKIEFRD